MAVTNRERIARGMELLRAGLLPFAIRELRSEPASPDPAALLGILADRWQDVFRHVLGDVERAYVGELQQMQTRWSREEPLSSDDTERTLDTMKRLLEAVSAAEQADEVSRLRLDLQRTVYAEQARSKTRITIEGMPRAGLKPWREVVTPHPDVQSGRYMQAEFAADLAQVHRGEGAGEYRDPVDFFRRTYITVGLEDLLVGALERLSGKGGDPVVELQTNFGGGKTHSMLALYHLFGAAPSIGLPGIEPLLRKASIIAAPTARRAVLVGTDLSPGQIHRKPDGTLVRTLWGEMAWQLGGPDGYAMVADSDARGVSPGGALLGEVFRRFAPCLVLIDEWVAYARQVVGKRDLPSGDFESQTTFAQALTEAAKAVDRTLVVASVPASKIEIGGENGELALNTLKDVLQRIAKAWRPASGDEGFEIVRRRLFEPLVDHDAYISRDAVLNAFARMYRDAPGDFSHGSAEESYRRELEAAYPIHPELFRRLYDDWSTLDKFQRTRGVLRLLAKVIHRLWESGDTGLLILPGFVPMDDGPVKSELTRYLPDVWEPIISQDVDGPSSLPLELDRTTPSLGRVSACRRVARTLYLATAPQSKNPGIDDRRVRLGCLQPGETAATFGDALRRIGDRAKYIHQDGNRYWISTKPNLNRMAEDRASGFLREPEELYAEIDRRLAKEQKHRGEFAAVHACPESSADVPDEPVTRLVILSPRHAHKKGHGDSPARTMAGEILANKGNGPRLERNCLVFLAPDRKELDSLLEATAQFLAWKSIHDQSDRLNLDHFHEKQAETKTSEHHGTVDIRIASAWQHALVPTQDDARADLHWEEVKVAGGAEPLAKRAATKLKNEEKLMPVLGGLRLRMALNKVWEDKDHVSVGQIAEWFARYLYLPRVTSVETLHRAVQDGATNTSYQDTFGVAEGWDATAKRYIGLRCGQGAPTVISKSTLVVKPEIARHQMDADQSTPPAPEDGGPSPQPQGGHGVTSTGSDQSPTAAASPPNVYVGAVRLDGTRIGRDAGKVAEEVLQHLSTLPGAEVEATLEIRVKVPGGIKDETVRTVRENARTLKFTTSAFEKE